MSELDDIVINTYRIRRYLEIFIQNENNETNVSYEELFGFIYEDNFEDNFDDLEDVKITLTKTQFDNLPTRISSEKETKICNICIENFNKGNCIITLKCDHEYHKKCLYNWLCKEKSCCPTCRHDCRDANN